jgi:glucuronate isomerase
VDASFLARLVAEHRLDEARELVVDLVYNLPRRAYRLDRSQPEQLARSA